MLDITALREIAHLFSYTLTGGFVLDCRDSNLYKQEFGEDIFYDDLLIDWEEAFLS